MENITQQKVPSLDDTRPLKLRFLTVSNKIPHEQNNFYLFHENQAGKCDKICEYLNQRY